MTTQMVKTIRYTGSAARASALVQMLEQHGVAVECELPREQRDAGGDFLAVGLGILASGAYDAIKVAVEQFLDRFPRAEVTIENEDAGPDDGGFLGQ